VLAVLLIARFIFPIRNSQLMKLIRLGKTEPLKNTTNKNQSVSLLHCISYSLPYAPMIWLGAPTAILQGIYAKYYGFSLITLASIVLLARLFDGVTDPLIGYYSDRYQRLTGTRKPLIVWGAILLIISSYFLYIPFGVDVETVMAGNASGTPAVSILYFTVWLLLFYFSYTLFDIPHISWGSDIATSGIDKSRVYSFRAAAGYIGLIFFYSIPMLPIFESRDITPATLKVSVISASILFLLFLYSCVRYTPNNIGLSTRVPLDYGLKTLPEKQMSRVVLLQSILKNRPLLLLYIAYMFYGLGAGLWYGVIFLYVDSYLDMGEQFAPMFLIAFVIGLAVTPVWYKASTQVGKKVPLAIAMLFLIASYIYSGLLTPGEVSVAKLMSLKIINTLGNACIVALIPAMLSEIVDYGTLKNKNKNKNTGIYFALYSLINKFVVAVGMGLGLAIIGGYGYVATASSQDVNAIKGLMLVMVWGPFFLTIIAMVLILLNPINVRRHRIIRCRLDSLFIRTSRHVSAVLDIQKKQEVPVLSESAQA